MPQYDPEKQYEWHPSNSVFHFTGQEFASFYHLLTQEMNQIGGATLAIKREAYDVMMRKFVQGVESGVIFERKEKSPMALSAVKADEDPAVKSLFS